MSASKSELVIGSSCGKLKPETMAALNKLAELSPEKVAIIHISYKEDDDGVCRFHLVAINRFGHTSKVKTLLTEALIVLLVERMIEAKKGYRTAISVDEAELLDPYAISVLYAEDGLELTKGDELFITDGYLTDYIRDLGDGDWVCSGTFDLSERMKCEINDNLALTEDILYEEKLESLAQMTECLTYADIMSFKGDKSVALQLAILAEEAMEDSDPEMVEDVTKLPEFVALIDYIVGPVMSLDRFGGECYESNCPFHDKEEPLCNANNIQMTRHQFRTEALCKSGECVVFIPNAGTTTSDCEQQMREAQGIQSLHEHGFSFDAAAEEESLGRQMTKQLWYGHGSRCKDATVKVK